MDFGGNPYHAEWLCGYAEAAVEAGFDALSVNDHMVFSVPWLDGPSALAVVVAHSGDALLATTVANVVVRGPVPLAKTLGAIDRLSGGRVVAGVGPGSSERDYEVVGIPFEDRWKRLDEAVAALRALWDTEAEPVDGNYHSTTGISLEPTPAQPGGPPIWIGSWGSAAGLRRTARLADGWLASAYNTTPADFALGWAKLRDLLADAGRDPDDFPNGLATMWFHITDDPGEAERVFRERLVPVVNRPEEILRDRLPVGPAKVAAAKIRAFADAGVQRVFVWPVADEIDQIRRFAAEVMPLVDS